MSVSPMRRRCRLLAASLTMAAAVFATNGLKPAVAESISVGEGIAIQWGQFYIADHFKTWEKAGLEVKPVTFASGRLVLDALLGGGVKLGTAAETPVAFAALNGLPVRVVGLLNKFEPFDLIAVSDIQSGKDLKGRKIGVAQGTNGHYFFAKILQSSGLTPSDVTMISMSPGDYVSALTNGSVDGFVWTEPHISQALAAGAGKFHVVSFPKLYLGYSAIITTKDTLDKNPDQIVAALKALIAADEIIKKDPHGAAEIVAERIKMDPKIAHAYWPRVGYEVSLDKAGLVKELQEQADWAIKAGIARPGAKLPNFDEVVVTAPYEAARFK